MARAFSRVHITRAISLRFVWFLSFTVGLAAIMGFAIRNGYFEVENIPVHFQTSNDDFGTLPIALKKEISGRISDQALAYKNLRIWDVNIQEMRGRLLKDEWVKSVAVSRVFPNQIALQVATKQPALLTVNNKGGMQVITDDGSIIASTKPAALLDLPVFRFEAKPEVARRLVRGRQIASKQNKFSRLGAESEGVAIDSKSLRAQAASFVSKFPSDGRLAKKNISEINYSEREGYSVWLQDPKIEVKFGYLNDSTEMRIERVGHILNYLNSKGLNGRVIDANFSKKFLVRLRKAP